VESVYETHIMHDIPFLDSFDHHSRRIVEYVFGMLLSFNQMVTSEISDRRVCQNRNIFPRLPIGLFILNPTTIFQLGVYCL
jgi:hypothetical protein